MFHVDIQFISFFSTDFCSKNVTTMDNIHNTHNTICNSKNKNMIPTIRCRKVVCLVRVTAAPLQHYTTLQIINPMYGIDLLID